MLAFIRHHLRAAGFFMKLSIQKQLEYPMEIIGTMLMIPLMYATGILLLYFITENYQSVGGWTFAQLAFLYGLGDLSHGLMMVFSVQNWWIGTYVLRGEFDRMLLRPLGVFFQFSVMYINVIGLMDVLVGGTIFFYACSLVGFQWTVGNTIMVILTVAGATLLRSAIFTIFCSTAFWTKRSESIVVLLNDFLERTTLYPLSIYPPVMQMALTFLIPIGFISFYPAQDLLDISGGLTLPLGMPVWTGVIGFLIFLISRAVFNMGLRKYESAGS